MPAAPPIGVSPYADPLPHAAQPERQQSHAPSARARTVGIEPVHDPGLHYLTDPIPGFCGQGRPASVRVRSLLPPVLPSRTAPSANGSSNPTTSRCGADRARGAPLEQDAMLVPFDWYTVLELGIAAAAVVVMVLVMSRPPRK